MTFACRQPSDQTFFIPNSKAGKLHTIVCRTGPLSAVPLDKALCPARRHADANY